MNVRSQRDHRDQDFDTATVVMNGGAGRSPSMLVMALFKIIKSKKVNKVNKVKKCPGPDEKIIKIVMNFSLFI